MGISQYLSKFAMGIDSQGILGAAKGGTGGTSGGGGSSNTPTITNITYPGDDTAASPAGGQIITLTGTGFATGATVIINGSPASAVSVVSTTQITFTSPALSAGSYIVYVVNTDGTTAISVPGLQISGVPAWTTAAGTLGTVSASSSVNYTVTATGDTPISYSVYSGSLPSGLTLNSSTGVISGNAPSPSTTTTYNFTVRSTDAQNQDTDRAFSITVNASTPPGQQAFTTVGTFSFTVPEAVSSICAVCIGSGAGRTNGGGGGGLRYINNLPVTPGEILTVDVGNTYGLNYGEDSAIKRGSNVLVYAGGAGSPSSGQYGWVGGTGSTLGAGPYGGTIGGGNGGDAGAGNGSGSWAGGGGAGGYSGNGGHGGDYAQSVTPTSGSGGGGGGGGSGGAGNLYGAGGGGVGIYGEGASGGAGNNAAFYAGAGSGGSGGNNGTNGAYSVSGGGPAGPGGSYGGGGGGGGYSNQAQNYLYGAGKTGAVRIIWGAGRAFPSTLTTDQ